MSNKLLNIRINRGVLASIFYNLVRLKTFQKPDVEESLNVDICLPSGVTSNNVYKNIIQLSKNEFVYFEDDQRKAQVLKSINDISKNYYIGLTKKGGLLCESFFQINWNYYWQHEINVLNDIEEVVFSTSYEYYFELIQKYITSIGIEDLETYEEINKEVLYWKRLNKLFCIKFKLNVNEELNKPTFSDYMDTLPELKWRRD